MALPVTRRHSLMLLGASAASSLASPSLGQQEIPEIDYEYLGMFPPSDPTDEWPYFRYRFDSSSREGFPAFKPAVDIPVFQRDKFILLNFIDPTHEERSVQQMRLLDRLARELSELIAPKRFLIADIFVRDNDGQGLYLTDYELMYRDNTLGRDQTYEAARIVPYGVAFSAFARDPASGVQRLMDFSVSRFNPSDAQNEHNVRAIAHNLIYHVEQIITQ